MLKIVADNFIAPEKKAEFLEYANELVEETRKEPGNISYVLCQDVADENHFTFIEEWKDQAAIESHNASKHFTKLVPKMGECASKSGTCYVYDIVI